MHDFKVKFYDGPVTIDTIQNEYLLLFIVHGSSLVSIADETLHLHAKDVLMINGNRHFKLQLQPDAFLLTVSIRTELLRELTHTPLPHFQCCSTKYSSIKYEQLIYLIYDLLGQYALEFNGMSANKLSSLYKICDHLIHSFMLTDNQPLSINSEDRLDPVFTYIAEHFSEPISLPSAAEQIHIAPASLSRLFKKNTGITFVQYVTNIRLHHAVTDLTGSQLPISDIALNNGFSTASQFNKVFKQKFGISPSEYRQKPINDIEDSPLQNPQAATDLLNKYCSKTSMVVVRNQKIRLQSANVDCTKGSKIKNPWGSILYLGFASQLLSGKFQHQIRFLKHNLDFQYGSINGLFSPEFGLIDAEQADHLNFVNLDHILDFFVENGLRPLIIFDNQILKMLRKLDEIYEIPNVYIFSNSQQFTNIIKKILDYVINRYGLKEVSNWKFTIWYYVHKHTLMGIPENFIDLWDDFYEAIREKIPDASVGGVSYSPSVHRDNIVKFYRVWKQARNMPDFITINSFPYREAEKPTKMNAVRQNIDHFFSNDLADMHSILAEAQFPECPIIVMEWNLSFVQRNAFNDMAGKAAIMIAQMVDTLGDVDDVCYWQASDIFAGDFDAKRILNGASGLISSDGFCKPPYYALLFFKQLHNYLIERDRHYIVTKNSLNHFSIILFNNKSLNYEYYSKDESAIEISDEQKIFSNHDSLEITLTLQNIPNRNYQIRKQIFGPESGSILDEWKHLGRELHLTLNETSYLKRRSIPLRKNETVHVEYNKLILQELLQAHEIMLIQIN